MAIWLSCGYCTDDNHWQWDCKCEKDLNTEDINVSGFCKLFHVDGEKAEKVVINKICKRNNVIW